MDPMSCQRCGGALSAGICPRCLLSEGTAERVGGHLELGEPVGRGGMGEVFRARDVRLGREVAVKFLPESLASSDEARRRFEREARALARLNHPNIVTLYEFGEEDGQPFLVMELVEGAPLPSRLPLPRAEAVRIAIAVCDAVAFAHGQGVVHRDVKPANVLVGIDGRVKVADFGIARLMDPESGPTLTQSNVVAGTPQYTAPEALKGAAPSPAMDVFSIGVLLYELCTARLPVGEHRPLDPELSAIVRRAMAYEPAERFPSVAALGEALRKLSERSHGADLPEHEHVWLRAVALVWAVAASLIFFAGVSMLTPKVTERGELLPLMFVAPEALPDGRMITRARFEVFPALLATLGLGAAIAAWGLLRRHWRANGLDRPASEEKVPQTGWVLVAGGAAVLLYLLRLWMEGSGFIRQSAYVPVLGGFFELAVVYLAISVLLEARRRRRSVLREPLLWTGCLLAVIPPVIEFVTHVQRWAP